ncbi:MAG: hypothetical protein KA239_00650 [Bacteroidia bacterium]|nr:hypothetical protein [Bacteroidia bacterium]
MNPFSNNPNDRNEVPAWADFFTAEEFQAFDKAVVQYFKSLGKPFKVEDGIVRTTWMSDDSEMQNLGLMNVAQMCKQAKIEEYAGVIRNHFDVMRKSKDFIAGFFENINDFEFVKPFIGTRLYHKDHIKSIGPEGVIAKSITEEIIAMLVFDMPQAISSIKPEQSRIWGKSAEELLELGLANIRESYDFSATDLDANVKLKAVIQNHFFGSNVILNLDRVPGLVGTHGSLVAVPHRHSTLIHPIEDSSVLKAINMLIPMAYGMHHEGPGSITSQLYWYRQGKFMNLPYKIADNSINFQPPSDFVAMLEYLAFEESDQ